MSTARRAVPRAAQTSPRNPGGANTGHPLPREGGLGGRPKIAPIPFQEFQISFGRHLRDPRGSERPAGVPARRAGLYRELLRNNLEGFLLTCYPVSREMLGPRRWCRLVDAFFRDARCQTPYFREIPREFLRWLTEAPSLPVALPPWALELAHYEWVELALDVMDVPTPAHEPAGDLMEGRPVLAPALMNLAYHWPVQRIGPAWNPRKPQQVQLLVYRDVADRVRFIELNPVSARLVTLLQEGGISGARACLQIVMELQHPDTAAVLAHGAALLNELQDAGAILGAQA